MSEHQHRRHRESRFRRVLRTYKFEIAWLIVIALGIFLIFERLSIRSALIGWLKRASAAALGGAGQLDEIVNAFLARTTLSDVVGYVLVLGAMVAIFLRLRWRVMRDPVFAALQCPKCNGDIHRVHRRRFDHFTGLFVPVRRYRCANDQCRWCGLRVGTGHGESRASVRESL